MVAFFLSNENGKLKMQI